MTARALVVGDAVERVHDVVVRRDRLADAPRRHERVRVHRRRARRAARCDRPAPTRASSGPTIFGAIHVANASLSQMSSHHAIVT